MAEGTKSVVRRVNWNKLDHDKYTSLLAERLSTVQEGIDINEKVEQITCIITSTAVKCAPLKKNSNLKIVKNSGAEN